MSNKQHLQDLKDIKSMMEQSSRFISLSGWSGVAAGTCALIGAAFAQNNITANGGLANYHNAFKNDIAKESFIDLFSHKLVSIAAITFIAAFLFAFLFTYLRAKKVGTQIWGSTAKRLLFSVLLPMVVGGLFLFRQIQYGNYELLAPGCLIFYGLALVNASKHTLPEIKYLGYVQLILGLINCWFISAGLFFWALGFGVMHIVYGIVMWYKHERG
jgi:hypothetical protein